MSSPSANNPSAAKTEEQLAEEERIREAAAARRRKIAQDSQRRLQMTAGLSPSSSSTALGGESSAQTPPMSPSSSPSPSPSSPSSNLHVNSSAAETKAEPDTSSMAASFISSPSVESSSSLGTKASGNTRRAMYLKSNRAKSEEESVNDNASVTANVDSSSAEASILDVSETSSPKSSVVKKESKSENNAEKNIENVSEEIDFDKILDEVAILTVTQTAATVESKESNTSTPVKADTSGSYDEFASPADRDPKEADASYSGGVQRKLSAREKYTKKRLSQPNSTDDLAGAGGGGGVDTEPTTASAAEGESVSGGGFEEQETAAAEKFRKRQELEKKLAEETAAFDSQNGTTKVEGIGSGSYLKARKNNQNLSSGKTESVESLVNLKDVRASKIPMISLKVNQIMNIVKLLILLAITVFVGKSVNTLHSRKISTIMSSISNYSSQECIPFSPDVGEPELQYLSNTAVAILYGKNDCGDDSIFRSFAESYTYNFSIYPQDGSWEKYFISFFVSKSESSIMVVFLVWFISGLFKSTVEKIHNFSQIGAPRAPKESNILDRIMVWFSPSFLNSIMDEYVLASIGQMATHFAVIIAVSALLAGTTFNGSSNGAAVSAYSGGTGISSTEL